MVLDWPRLASLHHLLLSFRVEQTIRSVKHEDLLTLRTSRLERFHRAERINAFMVKLDKLSTFSADNTPPSFGFPNYGAEE